MVDEITTLKREEKLPEWAQSELKRLRMRLDEARRDADVIQSNSVTRLHTDIAGVTKFLPEDSKLWFVLGNGDEVTVRLDNGVLLVQSYDSLTVKPRSNNMILVGTGC